MPDDHDIGCAFNIDVQASSFSFATLRDKSSKDLVRYRVTLPRKLRVPLYSENEMIVSRIFDGFNQSVGRPGRGFKIATHFRNGLVMMRIHTCVRFVNDITYQTIPLNP